MSHEVSETVNEPGGTFQNISGITGKPLDPLLPIEKQHYDSIREAVNAAVTRSAIMGQFLQAVVQRHREAQTMPGPTGVGESLPKEEPGAFPFRR